MHFPLRILFFSLIALLFLSSAQNPADFPPFPPQHENGEKMRLGVDELFAKGIIRPMLMMMSAVIKNFAGDDDAAPPKNRTEVEQVEELLTLAGENVTFAVDANETNVVEARKTAARKARRKAVFRAAKLF